MKILLSADFHGDFTRLFQIAKNADICLCTGDIFDYHQYPKNFSFPIPFYSIRGNKEIWGANNLESRLHSYNNFHWLQESYDELIELTGMSLLGINHNETNKLPSKEYDMVISHQPAYGFADQCSDSFHIKMIKNCGSKNIRRLIDENPPKLFIAGHVHYFQHQITDTTIFYTLGPALTNPVLILDKNKIKLFNY
ncbi:metallophosphoesterase family protein [Candidatus Hodarchaeum mangrovi]